MRHNKALANTPHMQRVWADVANRVLQATKDEGRAVREANSAVKNARLKAAAASMGIAHGR
ncbi:hypothetical protein [Sulfuricaulis sp.]